MAASVFPHPLIRVLLLILLAASLPAFDLRVLLLLLVLLLLAGSRSDAADWRRMLAAPYRLRWLLLSILVLHLGFAADRVAAFGGAIWLPAPAALQAAGEHALLLVVLLAGVELLRQSTPAAQVAAALVSLLEPIRLLGVDTRRFALRLALTLEAVPRTGRQLHGFTHDRKLRRRSLTAWAEAAAALVQATEREARIEAEQVMPALPALPGVRPSDWLALGGGGLALLLLGMA